MANPNPENLNAPNKGVPEEDPHHLLDYNEEEDPKMDIEEKEPEEEPVEEPEPLPGHGDHFDAHPNPQPGNMNGWVDDDDDVEKEDKENEDVDIEEDDDAEIIFPYEVQGDQTPPPRDVSSDSGSEPEAEEDDDEPEAEEADDELEVEEAGVKPEAKGADVELEAEEPDGVPEATIGTGSQRPFAVRDFPMGIYEAGESSTAPDPQFIGGLAPWALRRDLEALRRHERIMEAESETSRTEVTLLGSEAKIGKMEREILHHDLSGVEETLGKVVERLKVLESKENATLRKKLAEKEVLLDLTRMERDRAEKRLSESIRIMPPKPMSKARMREIIRDQFATSMNEFMANMNSGAGGSGRASGFGGAGGSGGTGEMLTELVSEVPDELECKEKDRVKFDMATLRGRALTWWKGRTKAMGIEAANNTPWSEVRKWMTGEFCPWSVIQRMEQELYNLNMKGMDIDGYTNRFHELALLCPRMVEPEAVKVEQYLRGLTKSIRGDVTSSQPTTINDVVRLAYQLARQLIQDKADEATKGKKRKGEGDRGSRGDNRQMIVQMKNRLLAACSRQKSYADVRHKPLEFEVGDRVMLKVSPWKGVIRYRKPGKLSPRYIGPFKILSSIGSVAYKLDLPQELHGIHNTFHVSNLRKCLADEELVIPLDEVKIDDKLHFIEEPVEIIDREVKQLKQSRIPIVNV
nr:putative reverse transcriptase domain-containing protein [Tanacetum cinerariifolium]